MKQYYIKVLLEIIWIIGATNWIIELSSGCPAMKAKVITKKSAIIFTVYRTWIGYLTVQE